MISSGNLWPNRSPDSATAPEKAWMPRIRRKLARIFAPLLVALFISSPQAPRARASQASSPGSSAQKSWLDTPARELARRIAAVLPSGALVGLGAHSESSLNDKDAAVVQAAMLDELDARGFRTGSGEGRFDAGVIVTLSENTQGYVWVAQILGPDGDSALLQFVPRGALNTPPFQAENVVLQEELLWSGPTRILDAAESPASDSTPSRLFLLEFQGAKLVVTDSLNTFRTELPALSLSARDPEAHFLDVGASIYVSVGGDWLGLEEAQVCTLSLDGHLMRDCETVRPTDQMEKELENDLKNLHIPPQFGDQFIGARPSGRMQEITLCTGLGDYTQPDTVTAYASDEVARVLSAPASFSGPVLRLGRHSDWWKAIAIVQNLQNGNYEVYRITVSSAP